MWGRRSALAGFAVVLGLSVSGCDAFYYEVFCGSDERTSFTLGGVEVDCQAVSDERSPPGWISVLGPTVAGQPVPFRANTPSTDTSLRVSWEFTGDGSDDPDDFADATGRSVEHTFPTPTPPGEQASASIRIVSASGDQVGLDREVRFLVGNPATGPIGPGGAATRGGGPQSRFSARLAMTLFEGEGRITERGGGVRLRRVIGVGDLDGELTNGGSATLERFLDSTWLTRLSAVRTRSGRLAGRGVALARFPETSGESCLRYRLGGSKQRPVKGRLRVLGGTDEAGTLAGRARFRAGFDDGDVLLTGKLRERTGQPRELPTACAPLASFPE